ncbi:hypothetical protein [Chitinophaga varians]|uniref:hypothetical protein n=1 Tax=Chitinophaga varians TaxID=2202339 RepID=UPI00165F872C|nr:hypothetical protein [Chitinophaga varians]MBC9914025.1 hypothetical protein [Chitinophaga varians]
MAITADIDYFIIAIFYKQDMCWIKNQGFLPAIIQLADYALNSPFIRNMVLFNTTAICCIVIRNEHIADILTTNNFGIILAAAYKEAYYQ